ncbi:MAG: hypothetical protein AAF579_16855 [Cyanobacteria bacterium P01_C01_bin.118]
METTHIAFTQAEPAGSTNTAGHDGGTIFVGTSVLIYVLLLFVLAPRRLALSRRKSSL